MHRARAPSPTLGNTGLDHKNARVASLLFSVSFLPIHFFLPRHIYFVFLFLSLLLFSLLQTGRIDLPVSIERHSKRGRRKTKGGWKTEKEKKESSEAATAKSRSFFALFSPSFFFFSFSPLLLLHDVPLIKVPRLLPREPCSYFRSSSRTNRFLRPSVLILSLSLVFSTLSVSSRLPGALKMA